MEKYYPPKFRETKFHCIHCGVFSAQKWQALYYQVQGGFSNAGPLESCVCVHCSEYSYWYKGSMIQPRSAPVPRPHIEMPAECLRDYTEARDVVVVSPRAASALLRLAVQKLMVVLGEKGKSINDDIAALVGKGLSVRVQQALDFCRVVGNNAVHPGEINIDDTPEIAHSLFEMMNYIVEDKIAKPKQIESLYNKLPEAARKAIEKRDAP